MLLPRPGPSRQLASWDRRSSQQWVPYAKTKLPPRRRARAQENLSRPEPSKQNPRWAPRSSSSSRLGLFGRGPLLRGSAISRSNIGGNRKLQAAQNEWSRRLIPATTPPMHAAAIARMPQMAMILGSMRNSRSGDVPSATLEVYRGTKRIPIIALPKGSTTASLDAHARRQPLKEHVAPEAIEPRRPPPRAQAVLSRGLDQSSALHQAAEVLLVQMRTED